MTLPDVPRPAPERPDADARALKRAWKELNDIGNAQRLYDHADGRLLWIEEVASWVAFDGRRWSIEDGEAMAMATAHRVAGGLRAEANALKAIEAGQLSEACGAWCTPDIRDERVSGLHGWLIKTGDSARTQAMLKQARAIVIDGRMAMRARLEDFDRDPRAYNCGNGVLRFARRDGEPGWRADFEPGHRPGDMMMQIAAVDYDPEQSCPHWIKRLEILQPNAEQRAVLPRLYGSTLTGLISDQAFYVQQGKGGDGKSMTHMTLGAIHGDYFRTASPKTFLEGPAQAGSAHQSDIVRLRGDIRMVLCDEPKANSVWDGERIKQVTGSAITARGAHERAEITYRPHWKLFVECNPLPRAPSDDEGFRRRLKLFIWPVSIHKTPGLSAEPEEIVSARLLDERSGILNWLIAGALDWLDTMKIPETGVMKQALANYWSEASPLGDWFEDYVDLADPNASEPATPLYQHFVEWSEAQGKAKDKIMSQTTFGRLLTARHIFWFKGDRGIKHRRGVRLRSESEAAARAAPPASTSGEAPTVHGNPIDED